MSNKVKVTPHGERAILITRSFKAPRELVFDAMTKPEMMMQWFHGPSPWKLTRCTMVLRVGANYRWVWTNDKGNEMGVAGTVLEVDPPLRMKVTEQFDDPWYEGEATSTLMLTEETGGTLMSMIVEYATTRARDSVLASPMSSGLDASYDQLDVHLALQH